MGGIKKITESESFFISELYKSGMTNLGQLLKELNLMRLNGKRSEIRSICTVKNELVSLGIYYDRTKNADKGIILTRHGERKKLALEFKVSVHMVNRALKGASSSALAVKIRDKAIENGGMLQNSKEDESNTTIL